MNIFTILFNIYIFIIGGMIMNRMYNSPAVLLKGIQARFLRGIATTAVSILAPFFDETKSDSNKETYVLFNHFGVIKEWLDEVDFSFLEDFDYEIKNKDWQNGFIVDRNTLDDSRKTLGNDVEREINFSLNSWTNFPDKLVSALIESGETSKGFDGSFFFAATHPKLSGTTAIKNLSSGTGVTLTAVAANLSAAMVLLRGFKAKNGDPFNYNPKFLCMIPAHLEWIFRELKNSTQLLSGGVAITNIYKDAFDFIVNDYISGNSWYIVNTNSAMKPFIYQTRKNPEFNMKDEKDKKFVKYFSTARMNVGFGNPTAIVKVSNV